MIHEERIGAFAAVLSSHASECARGVRMDAVPLYRQVRNREAEFFSLEGGFVVPEPVLDPLP
jgi:hypothetical protein